MKFSARMQKKQWNIRPMDCRAEALAGDLHVSPIVAQVLLNREISDKDEALSFLRPRLTGLISPERFGGMTEAVAIIKGAILGRKKITIFGDYDVDGITSVSILTEFLTIMSADVEFYIPHRIKEGYGLNKEAIAEIAKNGTDVLVTVDCGISAIESVKFGKELGMQIVITDHHQPAGELPEADAIVHAAIDPGYPNQDSCGAMVAFKLAWAVANEFSGGSKLEPELRQFMIDATSLAAMGTVADVMNLKGENRILTHFGLKGLSQCQLAGVQALIETANLGDKELDSFDIGFRLAPMLNAAGRMGHARLAVELLRCENSLRAMQIAEYLKRQNYERQQTEKKIFKHVCEVINSSELGHPDQHTIVVCGQGWHPGVVGIVASRLVDRYYKPTIVLNAVNGTAQGSGRSIAGFDLLAGIKACSKHVSAFGGHKMAAGVTLSTKNVEGFKNDFEAYAKQNLTAEQVINTLDIDAAVKLKDLSMNTVNQLTEFAPFGQGNPRPVFATRGLRLAGAPRKVGAKGDHLQLTVTDNTATVRCIGFKMGKYEKKLLEKDFFSLAYEPDINHFNGQSTVQLVLSDINFD